MTSTGIESTARRNVWASRCRRKTATPFIQNAREVCSTCFPRWSREIYSGWTMSTRGHSVPLETERFFLGSRRSFLICVRSKSMFAGKKFFQVNVIVIEVDHSLYNLTIGELGRLEIISFFHTSVASRTRLSSQLHSKPLLLLRILRVGISLVYFVKKIRLILRDCVFLCKDARLEGGYFIFFIEKVRIKFRQEKSAKCMGKGYVNGTTCQNWFSKF